MVGDYLISWETVRFPRKNPIHGVSKVLQKILCVQNRSSHELSKEHYIRKNPNIHARTKFTVKTVSYQEKCFHVSNLFSMYLLLHNSSSLSNLLLFYTSLLLPIYNTTNYRSTLRNGLVPIKRWVMGKCVNESLFILKIRVWKRAHTFMAKLVILLDMQKWKK
jgi:hypothetical protein